MLLPKGGEYMYFSQLELLFLRRMIVEDLEVLTRRYNKLIRWTGHDNAYHEKMAVCETELKTMQEIKEKVDKEIALRTLMAEINE